MEAAFVNVVRPGDVVVVGVNGVFGERMCDVAARCGAEVVRVEAEWGRPIDPAGACSTPIRPRRSSPSCTPRRRPACATTSRRWASRQGRRAAARRLRDLARRHPGRDRRLGRRHRLQRHPEVPRRAAGPGAAHRRTARRDRFVERAAVVVPRPRHARRSTSRPARAPHVPPHRADLDDLRPARRARCAARRGPRGRAGRATPTCGAALQAGLEKLGFELFAAGGPPPARADHRVGARRRRLDEAGGAAPLLDRYGIEIGGGLGAVRRQGLAHRLHGPHRPACAT